MLQLLLPWLAILLVLSIIGLPVVLWALRNPSAWDRRIAVASAPLWGITVLSLTSSWGHSIPILPKTWIIALLALAITALIPVVLIRTGFKQLASDLWSCAVPSILIASLTILVNGRDLASIGLNEYFPLTNADTFNYLGLIEQIRHIGAYSPQLVYPVGTSIRIEHAIPLRSASGFVVAAFADIGQLESAQGFFLSLRLGLALAILGATLVAAAAARSIFPGIMVLIFATGTNLLLPQVLQQFLSSVLGLSQFTAVALATIWVFRSGLGPGPLFLLGISVGTYGLMSPESHPFVLVAFIATAAVLLGTKAQLPMRTFVVSALGYLLAIVPWGRSYFDMLFGQVSGTIGHSGDFFAQPGVVLYATGLAIWDGRPLLNYINYERWSAIAMISLYAAGSLLCVRHARSESLPIEDRRVHVAFGMIGSVALAAQLYAYAQGKGFLLSKLIDYFSFFMFVLVVLAVINLASRPQWGPYSARSTMSIRSVLLVSALGLLGIHVAMCVPHKTAFLATYVKFIKTSPSAREYVVDPRSLEKATAVWADLGPEPMGRFLWENRWSALRLHVPAELTARFRGNIPFSFVSHIVQMSGIAIRGAKFVDINRARNADGNSALVVVEVRNYLRIIEGSGWLGPEGSRAQDVWRWLSGQGEFEVLLPCTSGHVLNLELAAGPDTTTENEIAVYFDGKRHAVVTGQELLSRSPVTRRIPIRDVCVGTAMKGSIVVTGPKSGIRQVRVGALYVRT